MHKLKNKLREEIREYDHDGRMSLNELEKLHVLTDTLKNLYKIDRLDDGGDGYSGARHWVRGHYSRDGYGGRDAYEGGYSDRRDDMGRYARDDYSRDGKRTREHLEAALASADPEDRKMIERLISRMD